MFRQLDSATLGAIAREFVDRSYRRGQLIFYQGDPGSALFVVAEGRVKVSVLSEEGDELVLAVLRPSELFGELALIDGGPRTASAEALEESKLLTITRDSFLRLLSEHPPLSEGLLLFLAGLLRRLTGRTADLVFLDLQSRVAKFLVEQAEKTGEKHEATIALDLDLTQADLAHMVGGSRSTVNQILRSFENRGFLHIEGRRIFLTDLVKLEQRAGL